MLCAVSLRTFRLVESFFEHDGQAVCAKCKHDAIAYAQPPVPYVDLPLRSVRSR